MSTMFTAASTNLLFAICREKLLSICVPVILGNLSGMSGRQGATSDWYKSLNKPPGLPPSEVFPIVWMGLYACMGWTAHMVVKVYDLTVSPSTKAALHQGMMLYWIQLGINLAWSPLFFRQKRLFAAFVCNLLLAGIVYCMTNTWDKATNHKTTYLLAPYCVWILYAAYLGGGTWWLNVKKKAAPSQAQTAKKPSKKEM